MIATFAQMFIAQAVVVKGSKAKLFSQSLGLFSNRFTHRGVEITVFVWAIAYILIYINTLFGVIHCALTILQINLQFD